MVSPVKPAAPGFTTSETERVYPTPGKVRKMQQEHSTCNLFSWNMTPLIASHTLARATQSTRGKLRNPVTPSSVADTERQFQVCRESALALAQSQRRPFSLCGFGDIAQGVMIVSLGRVRAQWHFPLMLPSPVGREKQ